MLVDKASEALEKKKDKKQHNKVEIGRIACSLKYLSSYVSVNKELEHSHLWQLREEVSSAPGPSLLDYHQIMPGVVEAFPMRKGVRVLDLRVGGTDLDEMPEELFDQYREVVETKFNSICPDETKQYLEEIFDKVAKEPLQNWETVITAMEMPCDDFKQKVLSLIQKTLGEL
ncbi:hypothetical protein HDU86_005798 [Geranomyces michiganensis]|nr:hypothetical protein HDU86_005798 [Geranomyces michiganensis]